MQEPLIIYAAGGHYVQQYRPSIHNYGRGDAAAPTPPTVIAAITALRDRALRLIHADVN